MHTIASKNSVPNGSDRASAWIGKTPSSTPASRIRCKISEALNHRSVAHTCTPNSRRRKTDDIANPQPRSSTRAPDRKVSASVSHSTSHSALAPAAGVSEDPLRVVARRAREASGDQSLVLGHVISLSRWILDEAACRQREWRATAV